MPLTRLSLPERIRLVRISSIYGKAADIQKVWVQEFGTDPPSRKTIQAINKKFDETGSVTDLIRTGRPKTTRTAEKIELVVEAIRNDPTKSIRTLASELGVNKASVHRIKKDIDKQEFVKEENKRLKKKLQELQSRLDILEGKKSTFKAKTERRKVKRGPKSTAENSEMEDRDMPYIVSTSSGIPSLQQALEILGVQHGQAQTYTVQHNVGLNGTTVITVTSSADEDPNQTDDDHEVRHLTIDEDGHLHHVEVEEQEVLEASDELITAEVETVRGITEDENLHREVMDSGTQDEQDPLISKSTSERDDPDGAEEEQEIVIHQIRKIEVMEHVSEDDTEMEEIPYEMSC